MCPTNPYEKTVEETGNLASAADRLLSVIATAFCTRQHSEGWLA